MTEDERRAIEQDCARLVTAFHVHVDAYEHDKVLELFDERAVVQHTVLGPIRGKRALKIYFDAKNTETVTLHVTTNILIDVIDETHARGSAYWSAYISPDRPLPAPLAGPSSVGRYDDEFVHTDCGWKFASRRQTPRFVASDAPSATLLKGGPDAIAKVRAAIAG
jgi:hypothetical protein